MIGRRRGMPPQTIIERCSAPGCVREATRACDYPSGHATCSKPLCNAHAVPVGFHGKRDFCPDHERKPADAMQLPMFAEPDRR